ncbi:TetR/AcrR family transcriptional regulator [Rheinheimera sp. 1928-s]|uniref:TetR/AcrR family transcriptional regulator n=1 Tax=Rheinheimera sp. 1928-s TaxID=3033803 RepID=UPI00261BB5C2|nr:TetR/AcrR family transcriptional regulator [Rheinheimera sp. 1928-s]MDF3124110.1 TetR/AcrR family transcriptional regulator [Rheinheimera sp. 1928-s]
MEQDKKQQLVETALSLFYRYGVHAVGINQILEQSAVAKKTLYHHFVSKDELLMATLELRHQRFYQWLEQQLNSADPANPADTLFDALSLWFEGKATLLGPFFGCYFQNCAAEYHGPDSAVLELCAQHKLKVKHLVNTHLQSYHLTEEGQSLLLDGLMLLKEGAISMALLHADAAVAQHAKKQARLLLKALS